MGADFARLELAADVLVIGGGPAGAWAALTARASGAADVVLVDKGYCGTSGATAPANTGAWYVEPEERERMIDWRYERSGGLASKAWMERVLEATYSQIDTMAGWGYRFPILDDGRPYRANLRGPDYMHFLRKQLRAAGVRILDHSPALELLSCEGAVAGARGFSRQQQTAWQVRATAVVLASGGCAFLSKALGCDVNTGDGLLMALELGAELSGMEFSAQYGISPAYSSVTKGLPYAWATLSDEEGNVLEGERMVAVGRALLKGNAYAVLDKANADVQRWLREGQPNCFLPHDRLGIDPFRQRFPITLRAEGTVRGSGGIRILDGDCSTQVPGLYAAGDAASREAIVGASSGGGSPNAAWAISSGSWAGRAAALHVRSHGTRAHDTQVHARGTVGLRPSSSASGVTADEVITAVQREVLPLDKNMFRTGAQLEQSLQHLDDAWSAASEHLHGVGVDAIRAREAAALLVCGRHAYRSALLREESRGLHRRLDLPDTDPGQLHHHASSGLAEVRVGTYRAFSRSSSPADLPSGGLAGLSPGGHHAELSSLRQADLIERASA